jgi:uncharacterized protein YecT (DUF1311 family)
MIASLALLGLFLASLPMLALAQDGPSFDCAAAASSAEELVCTDADLAALDRRLVDRFAAAVGVARSLDSGAEETETTLRAYQRGWFSGRDACWKEPDLRACVEREYLFREGQLVAEFLLEAPSSTVEYLCGESPLSMTLFETELPSIRVERGDTVDIGAAAGPDSTDTFYLRELGALTMTGAGADLTDPYGDVIACTRLD